VFALISSSTINRSNKIAIKYIHWEMVNCENLLRTQGNICVGKRGKYFL
jgi:hypothetical protein